MHRRALTIAVCALCLAGAREASAQAVQDWTDRGYFNFNVGFESTSGTLNDAVTFRLYDEDGTKGVDSAVDSGAFFDFSVGGRVWRNVSRGHWLPSRGHDRSGRGHRLGAQSTGLQPPPQRSP